MLTTNLALRMPASFTAFCLLHHENYLRYLQARLPDRVPCGVLIESVLGDLATQWPAALSSPCTAAAAWIVLRRWAQGASRQCHDAGYRGHDTLHRALPPEQADVLLLHRELALSVQGVAALIGTDRQRVNGYLTLAEKNLDRLRPDHESHGGAQR
ncbi:sigma factor-like helix-turn-helix DNA-binding protein [Streptomyces carpaticus]|uniref:sigma factor-like helix-turn-helix DNA-binding protein n=1 Tax=Streptomyces carpaticus TaxID=285558 RepID=UPI0031F7D448